MLRASAPSRDAATAWTTPEKPALARSLPIHGERSSNSSVAMAVSPHTGGGSRYRQQQSQQHLQEQQQQQQQQRSHQAPYQQQHRLAAPPRDASAAPPAPRDRGASAAEPLASDPAGCGSDVGGGSGDGGVDIVRAACALLDRVVGACSLSSGGDNGVLKPELVFAPIFHSVSVPGISGGDYLVHHLLRLGLARKEHLSEVVVLHAFLLIDRLLQRGAAKGFHLCTRNVHRVLLATTLLSAKLLDDECYNNTYWAQIGGVSLSHLNALEVEVTALLDFQLLVTGSMIEAARTRLVATA